VFSRYVFFTFTVSLKAGSADVAVITDTCPLVSKKNAYAKTRSHWSQTSAMTQQI